MLPDASSFRDIFEKHQPKYVIHLAAVTRLKDGEENPELTIKTNYFGTKLLAGLSVEFGIKTFLFISSNLARMPKSVIGLTKYLSEAYLMNQNSGETKLLALRLANVPGSPGSVTPIFDKQIKSGGPVTITDPRMERRFVSREEACGFITNVLAIGKSNKTFVIRKQNTRIVELAKEMIEKSGKSIEIKFIGIKPGEKLIEESYLDEEVVETEAEQLALLRNDWPDRNIESAVRTLTNKGKGPDFESLLKEIKLSLHLNE
jgi:FlaA1/EpsC-like NDP-sugar epimerase